MFPFDKKAIDICKQHKYAFFEHANRIIYGEYINNSYLSKSLPGITIENKEELELIKSIIGEEYIRIVGPHYIEFLDPTVIEYKKISAPLCFIHEGHFTYKDERFTGTVPSQKMLKAAECIYPLIKLCISQKLAEMREERLYTEFFKNTLDGYSAIIHTYLSKDKISKDFIILLKRKQNNQNVFFILRRNHLLMNSKENFIEFNVDSKFYDFVVNGSTFISKKIKKKVYVNRAAK